ALMVFARFRTDGSRGGRSLHRTRRGDALVALRLRTAGLAGHVHLGERLLDLFRVHLDGALEAAAFLDPDLRRRDVAAHVGVRVYRDALGRVQVAFRRAVDRDRLGVDVGLHTAFAADREVGVLELHGARDVALDAQVLVAAHVAVDLDRAPDHRGLAAGRARSRRGG